MNYPAPDKRGSSFRDGKNSYLSVKALYVYSTESGNYATGFEALMRTIDPKRFKGTKRGDQASAARIIGTQRPDGGNVYGKSWESY